MAKKKLDLAKVDRSKLEELIKLREYKVIGVGDICPNPYNKNRMGEKYFTALKTNLANSKVGFTIPVLVRPNPNTDSDIKWMIIDGEHRWKAAKEVGYQQIPCIVFPQMDESLAKYFMIESNSVRGDTSDADIKKILQEIEEEPFFDPTDFDVWVGAATEAPEDLNKYDLDGEEETEGLQETQLVSLYFTPVQIDFYKRIVGQYRLAHGVTAEQAVFDMIEHFSTSTGFGTATGDDTLDQKQSDLVPKE